MGTFNSWSSAQVARLLFLEAGQRPEDLVLLSAVDEDAPLLRQRPECILRSGIRWAVIGALAVELPVVAALLFLPVDAGVRIFMAASVWKAGGLIGAWIGVMLGQDHGLEPEVARRYERLLRRQWVVLAVHVPRRMLRHARGMLVESGAMEVRDVEGTVEAKTRRVTAQACR